MASQSTIQITTGLPGSGKSYVRCARFIADDFFPNSTGIHYSNFPINIQAFKDFFPQIDPEEIERRIIIIPEDIITSWMKGTSGPWEWFKGQDIANAHIAIDEAHNIVAKEAKPAIRKAWKDWLAEIRHTGATIEFITQNLKQIAPEVERLAAKLVNLTSNEERRDPLLSIQMKDWYELRAKFITGKYNATVWETEKRNFDGKWIVQENKKFTFDPAYFPLYNSYSAPTTGGGQGKKQLRLHQRKSHIGLLIWFLWHNAERIIIRMMITAVIIWLCFFGGGKYVINKFLDGMSIAASTNTHTPTTTPDPKPEFTLIKSEPDHEEIFVSTQTIHQEQTPTEQDQAAIIAKLENEKKNLEAKLETNRTLIMISSSEIMLGDGTIIKKDQMITQGEFAGKRIAFIDIQNRRAKIHDGPILYLRSNTGNRRNFNSLPELPEATLDTEQSETRLH